MMMDDTKSAMTVFTPRFSKIIRYGVVRKAPPFTPHAASPAATNDLEKGTEPYISLKHAGITPVDAIPESIILTQTMVKDVE